MSRNARFLILVTLFALATSAGCTSLLSSWPEKWSLGKKEVEKEEPASKYPWNNKEADYDLKRLGSPTSALDELSKLTAREKEESRAKRNEEAAAKTQFAGDSFFKEGNVLTNPKEALKKTIKLSESEINKKKTLGGSSVSKEQLVEEERRLALIKASSTEKKDQEEATELINGCQSKEEEIAWEYGMRGQIILLNAAKESDKSREIAKAKEYFSKAAEQLGKVAQLQVQNILFASRVERFGKYVQYPSNAIPENVNQVLCYAELENFTSKKDGKGKLARLKVKGHIYDMTQTPPVVVDDFSLPPQDCAVTEEDQCHYVFKWAIDTKKYRREGQYRIKLKIQDFYTGKEGEGSMDFVFTGPIKSQPGRGR